MSRWLVGSSSSRMSGAATSALASSTRRLVPPESAENGASASRCSRFSTRSTSWCRLQPPSSSSSCCNSSNSARSACASLQRQAMGDPVVFGQELSRIAHAGGHHVEDRAVDPLGHFLGDQGHPQPLLAGDLAPLRGEFAADQLEQGSICRCRCAPAGRAGRPARSGG